MAKELFFSIALRKKNAADDFFFNHEDYKFIECNIDCEDRYWIADPFVFEYNNEVYVFFEAYDLLEKKGKIGYSKMIDSKSFGKIQIVIDEKFHLSFPYIFRFKDDVYIMPESANDYRVKTYKSISFPDKWEVADILVPDIYGCDSILFEHKNEKFLLCNDMYHNAPNNKARACWVKNIIFNLNKKDCHGTFIKEGDFGIRNAGKPFYIKDRLYRIGQDCTDNVYGKGLVLFEVKTLEPYSEEIVWSKAYDDFKDKIVRNAKSVLTGVHTYNFSENYEIIDFAYYKEIPATLKIKRLLFYAYNFIKKGKWKVVIKH